MGDHRAIIKLEIIDFHGISRKTEMNVNWNEPEWHVMEWLEEVHADGMLRYRESMAEYYQKQREDEERSKLAELKAKYEK